MIRATHRKSFRIKKQLVFTMHNYKDVSKRLKNIKCFTLIWIYPSIFLWLDAAKNLLSDKTHRIIFGWIIRKWLTKDTFAANGVT